MSAYLGVRRIPARCGDNQNRLRDGWFSVGLSHFVEEETRQKAAAANHGGADDKSERHAEGCRLAVGRARGRYSFISIRFAVPSLALDVATGPSVGRATVAMAETDIVARR